MSSSAEPVAVPRGGLDLLVQAALAPLDDARAAWRRWRATHDLDTTSWSEVRILAAVAGRIGVLEEDADVRPRIEGIRKFLWVHTQMCLEPAGPAFATVVGAGIPVLLMKGAARVVADPKTAHERLIRDVDALVPLGSEERALDLLRAAGWSLSEPPWAVKARAAGKVAGHHAWTLTKGRSEIDLHHFSNHLNRLTGDDDGLWRRATTATWRGVTVHLPSPADALVLAVTHGVRWSLDGAADWTVDAANLVDMGSIDWDIVLDEADSRLLHAVLHAGLAYLAGPLGRPVPRDVLDALARKTDGLARQELAAYAASASPRTPGEKQTALEMAAFRARQRAGLAAPAADTRFNADILAAGKGTIAPGHNLITCAIPQTTIHDWLLFQLDLDATAVPTAVPLTAQLQAPGLDVGSGPGAIHHTADGRMVVRFRCELPGALVVLRHLEQIAVKLSSHGRAFAAPTPVPMTVTWFRLVRQGS